MNLRDDFLKTLNKIDKTFTELTPLCELLIRGINDFQNNAIFFSCLFIPER